MNEFTQFVDLASERLGGRVLEANDEFFAPKENLLKPPSRFSSKENTPTRGKWMDGWETRRRRTPGCDWCIIRLGLPGIIRGAVVDTSFFTGNYPGTIFSGRMRSGRFRALQGRKEKAAGFHDSLERDFARNRAERGFAKFSCGDAFRTIYARALQDLSGRWRGAAARCTARWYRARAYSRSASWILPPWKMVGA